MLVMFVLLCADGVCFFYMKKLGGLNAHFIGVLENTIDTHKKLLVMGYNALLTSI